MENVVTAIFKVESEAYKAFTEIRNRPFGEGYLVAEVSLLKREGDVINVVDNYDAAGISSDDTASGMIVGSLVGILGGPLGVLLGAGAGALIGGVMDHSDAKKSDSMIETTAAKLYDGEIAIVALVQEDEPAFDAAFLKYEAEIIREGAVDVLEEAEAAKQAEKELENEVRQQLRAEHKEEVEGRIDEAKEKLTERKAELDDAKEIAGAQFTSTTKEMMGDKE